MGRREERARERLEDWEGGREGEREVRGLGRREGGQERGRRIGEEGERARERPEDWGGWRAERQRGQRKV